jgi:hypothetical protein
MLGYLSVGEELADLQKYHRRWRGFSGAARIDKIKNGCGD